MVKILMVCLGNICRSPLAEGVMRKKLAENNIQGLVDSCGFEAFHVGDAPDPRAIKVARENGLDISNLKARLFEKQDFDAFDHIFVMDSGNYRDVYRAARNQTDMEKVDYLMNLVYPGKNIPIPDPYMGDMEDFRETLHMSMQAADAMIMKIKKQEKI
ncbi:MAG: low molecular weight phosphotyrosine protein phosphatase [Lentimicrobiaceae bacterium]|jgi:protein-tyrosine phosphatase|nr:low molecular weight phosphotyrosine protein phosphatase [Lentimicrobiaceae bacterium]MDD4598106.1 low molecular weight phosphotyrosine protein phosphatase [Lentimicrobiaceae bacterium]MDY0024439.1 low molecular weight protein-tyrosine-phosphatase [Lentimicrobium sp.]HAH58195.1 protein-tyrosine-phosphatase [Bacteroidales bacterium]